MKSLLTKKLMCILLFVSGVYSVEYFGLNADGNSSATSQEVHSHNDSINIQYACPGTGDQTVTEIGVRCFSYSTGRVLGAIYTTGMKLIAQGDTTIDVSSGTAAWYTHTEFVDSLGDPITPILIGGNRYIIVTTGGGSSVVIMSNSVTSGYARYRGISYVTGFPGTLEYGVAGDKQSCARVGVEPVVNPVDSSTVTIVDPTHGTITADPVALKREVGDVSTFTLAADEHYHLLAMPWGDAFADSADNPVSYTYGSGDITVSGNTAKIVLDTHYVANTSDAHCQITYQGDSIAAYGETVRAYVAADAGYFVMWLGGNRIASDTMDIAVTKDTAITAVSYDSSDALNTILHIGDSVSKTGVRSLINTWLSTHYPGIYYSNDTSNNQGMTITTGWETQWCPEFSGYDPDLWMVNSGIWDRTIDTLIYQDTFVTFFDRFKRKNNKCRVLWSSTTQLDSDAPNVAPQNERIVSNNSFAIHALDSIYGPGEWHYIDMEQCRIDSNVLFNADNVHPASYIVYAHKWEEKLDSIIDIYTPYSDAVYDPDSFTVTVNDDDHVTISYTGDLIGERCDVIRLIAQGDGTTGYRYVWPGGSGLTGTDTIDIEVKKDSTVTAASSYFVRVWSSTGSTNLNLSTNWSGSGELAPTDSLVFDATSVVNATATANLNVYSINRTSDYTGNLSFSGYTQTYSGNAIFNGTGTLNMGNGITMNGDDDTLLLGSAITALTSSSCVFTIGTNVNVFIAANKLINTGKSLSVLDNATVSFGGTSIAYFNYGSSLSMASNSSLIITKTVGFSSGTNGDTLFTLPGDYNISGAGTLRLYFGTTNGNTLYIPNITTSTKTTIINSATAPNKIWALSLSGNISADTLKIIHEQNNGGGTFNAAGYNITCSTLKTGLTYVTSSIVLNYGSGNHTVQSFVGTTYNAADTTKQNLQTSTWNVLTNWQNGSNHTVDPGSSVITFYGGSGTIITTAGKSFYDVIVNKSVGVKDTISDSGYYHKLVRLNGKHKGISNGGTVIDSLVLGGSDTLFGRNAGSKWWDINIFRQTNTNVNRLLDSTKWDFDNGGVWSQDSNNAVKRVRLSDGAGGKKLTFTGGKKLTIHSGVAGDFSGVDGSIDTITAASPCTLVTVLSEKNLYVQNIIGDGNDTCFEDSGCVDGGGNYGILFNYDTPVVIDSIVSHPRRDSLLNVAWIGDTLYMHGTGYYDSTATSDVWLNSTGSVKCDIVSWSTTLIKVLVPAGIVRGYYFMRIVNQYGEISTRADDIYDDEVVYIKVPFRP